MDTDKTFKATPQTIGGSVKTVYLCTGFYDNEVIINQAQAAGADRILPKPIDPSLLA